jgi:hypothetical protein
MTDSANRTRPSRPPFDSQFEREESRVRSREEETRARAGSGTYDAVVPSAATATRHVVRESMAERSARIEHKMSVATMVLRRLPPTDGRARLLASAILRRDEVLLDAVLSGMTEEVVGLVSERQKPPL